MNSFTLTIPLMRKYTITDIDEECVDMDPEYLSRLIREANRQGLLGRRIATFRVEPSSQGTTLSMEFDSK